LPSSLVEFLVTFGFELLLDMSKSKASLKGSSRIGSKDAIIEVLERFQALLTINYKQLLGLLIFCEEDARNGQTQQQTLDETRGIWQASDEAALKLRNIDLTLSEPFNEPFDVEVNTIARYFIADRRDDRVCIGLISHFVG
jgi:hypothetical protein